MMECKPLRLYIEDNRAEGNQFLVEALKYIENHALFEHLFFHLLREGRLSQPQIQVWAKQRHFSSQAFPRFLAALVSNLVEEETRSAYVKQIYEEHGELVPEKIHARQLRNFIYALGVTPEELKAEPMLPGTANFVDAYVRLSRDNDVLKGMGVFALGSEPVVAMEMALVLPGLKRLTFLKAEDIHYFTDHAYHDFRHTAELMDVLMPYADTTEGQSRILEGMKEIIEARKGFYDGVAWQIGIC